MYRQAQETECLKFVPRRSVSPTKTAKRRETSRPSKTGAPLLALESFNTRVMQVRPSSAVWYDKTVFSSQMLPSTALGFVRALKFGAHPNRNARKYWGHNWGHVEVSESIEALYDGGVLQEFHSCSRPNKTRGYVNIHVTPRRFLAPHSTALYSPCLSLNAQQRIRFSGASSTLNRGYPRPPGLLAVMRAHARLAWNRYCRRVAAAR